MTSDPYAPSDSIDSTFLDINIIEREQQLKKQKQDDKLRHELALETSTTSASDRLQLEDQETDTSVRANKKREEREKNKLLKQFDALAESY